MVHVASLTLVRSCPVCGSRSIVMNSSGELVCASCGTVLDEMALDYGVSYRGEYESRRCDKCQGVSTRAYALLAKISKHDELKELLPKLSDELVYKLSRFPTHLGQCVLRFLRSVEPSLRLPLLEAVLDYYDGHYPLIAMLSNSHGVDKTKLRRAFRRLRKLCLGEL